MQAVDALGPIIGVSPLERPDPGLVAAVSDAGALGVLDLGRIAGDARAAQRAIAAVARRVRGDFGVRVSCAIELPAHARVVVCDVDLVASFADRIVLAQVV